ncbi:DHA2 family efflux MFS transporter permease subunit [Parenemella sanctibonifatiensis]|uniref:DHA2 family efflux MFS transporter permease subunit n=1 Tax=Parenemella sanctibonifatiensis TaxID=2016505 RepID=UPI0015C5B483|nr:DHA2 family efflux MFS transporter permease subunit [Parenemella sanctibonifatiensis]
MNSAPPPSGQPQVADEPVLSPSSSTNRDRIPMVVWLLLCAAFVVILNETIMSLALDTLMKSLGITAAQGQWLTTAFLLTMAVVIPVSGFLLTRFGTRTMFLVAMITFSTGTVTGGIASGFEMLVAARVIQGAGTAVMMPLLMTTVMETTPKRRRGQVMGVVSMVISVAPALGPTAAGEILRYFDWPFLFWAVLPIALVALVIGGLLVRDVGERETRNVDIASVILSAFGFGGVVYALNQIAGGLSPQLVIGIILAAGGLVGFVWRQRRLESGAGPLLDLRCFEVPTFRLGVIVMSVGFAALMGVAMLWPLFLQGERGLTPDVAGRMLLPGGLAMGVLGPVIGRIVDRFGPRVVVVPGSIVVAVMLAVMSTAQATTALVLLILMHVVMSLGLAAVFTPTFAVTLNDLPTHLYAHGSALLSTIQQVAGAAGAALLVTVMALSNQQVAFLIAAGMTCAVVVLSFRYPTAVADVEGAPAPAH